MAQSSLGWGQQVYLSTLLDACLGLFLAPPNSNIWGTEILRKNVSFHSPVHNPINQGVVPWPALRHVIWAKSWRQNKAEHMQVEPNFTPSVSREDTRHEAQGAKHPQLSDRICTCKVEAPSMFLNNSSNGGGKSSLHSVPKVSLSPEQNGADKLRNGSIHWSVF